jgi:hypothetical protein
MDNLWVAVDEYLSGTMAEVDRGLRANVRLVLENGQTVTVSASAEALRKLPADFVNKRSLLHVVAEQHLNSGRLRNVRLVRVKEYSPSYDEAALDRFAAKGREAWRDVPDAAAWVRDLRGGE